MPGSKAGGATGVALPCRAQVVQAVLEGEILKTGGTGPVQNTGQVLLLTPRPERDFLFRANKLRQIFADPAVIVIVAAAPVPAAAAPRIIC
jgi:hypothetical protein